MPKVVNLPKHLKPYAFHGVDFDHDSDREEVVGTCPFCAKAKKFSINAKTGQWRCFSCNTGAESTKTEQGGNVFTFLRLLHQHSMEEESYNGCGSFLESRGLLYDHTLSSWGVCRSVTDGTWLVPGYSPEGKMNQLYRYVKEANGRYRLYATPECNHCLHGVNLWDSKKGTVILCEGPWDAMCLWETCFYTKSEEGFGLTYTGNVDVSLLSTVNIIAVPGCNVFQDTWKEMLGGKMVMICYDNDHPRKHPVTGRVIPPAGYGAMQKVAQSLATAEKAPVQVNYMTWGGVDGPNLDLPDGYDVRDHLTESDNQRERIKQLDSLVKMMAPVPGTWIQGRAKSETKGKVELETLPCEKWDDLINQWRKPMKMTRGMDVTLSVMLASIASVKSVGDQLWIKVIGPAACGKTTLCEALAVSRKNILANSTMRGFHSGYKSDAKGDDDNGLIGQLYDKTLVTKDGDTLLESPNLAQILSEARDLYDSNSRTHYRNRISREYIGVRMTWILCGTSSLRRLDSSELGERFLDCVMMDEIDDDLEDEILWRKVNQAARNTALESNGKIESQHDPDLVVAMQMTGGYVDWLRANASKLLAGVSISEASKRRCAYLGKFVAHMRARPSKIQEEVVEREVATRLSSQLTRLAMCLSIVLNRTEVDEEVMSRVTKVAMDTARGTTLNIVKALYEDDNQGMEVKAIAAATFQTEEKMRLLLKFLRQLKVVEPFRRLLPGGKSNMVNWRLTERMVKIFDEASTVSEAAD